MHNHTKCIVQSASGGIIHDAVVTPTPAQTFEHLDWALGDEHEIVIGYQWGQVWPEMPRQFPPAE